MAADKKSSGGRRQLHTRVKTAKGRKLSSTLWLERQLNDPYVKRAKQEGYRSRAAFKLIELDDKFRFLKKGASVVDLGAAPGGWTQVAVQRTGERVLAMDIQEMAEVSGAMFLQLDMMKDDTPRRIEEALGGKVNVVLSDMAPSATGHTRTDHLRIMALCEAAYYLAEDILAPGGTFVAKVLQGGTERELLATIKQRFASVKHAKPPASRQDSAETYIVAQGFR